MSIDQISIEDADPSSPCACQSCDWRGPARHLSYACDYILTPGDPSPAGRCPACEATAYLDRPEDRAKDAAMELLAALRALTDWAREHTSPQDANSPHGFLVAAVSAIQKAEGEPYGTPDLRPTLRVERLDGSGFWTEDYATTSHGVMPGWYVMEGQHICSGPFDTAQAASEQLKLMTEQASA